MHSSRFNRLENTLLHLSCFLWFALRVVPRYHHRLLRDMGLIILAVIMSKICQIQNRNSIGRWGGCSPSGYSMSLSTYRKSIRSNVYFIWRIFYSDDTEDLLKQLRFSSLLFTFICEIYCDRRDYWSYRQSSSFIRVRSSVYLISKSFKSLLSLLKCLSRQSICLSSFLLIYSRRATYACRYWFSS
jgi:hypothetical protein